MDGYTTVTCSACNQAAYLERWRLEAPNWFCPSCGARNESTVRVPAFAGAVAGRATSPFAPPPPPTPAPSLSIAPPPTDGVAPPGKSRVLGKKRWVVVGVLVAIGIGGAISQSSSDSTTSGANSSAVSAPPVYEAPAVAPEPAAPEPAAYIPKPSDFSLGVKVLEKKCFGSAGCLITYRVDVSYGGPTLDPSTEYEVIYEVRGDEDGPITNTFTVLGDSASVDSEEMASTKNSKVKLSAKVTEVVS